MKRTVGSLCSGIEAASVAWEPLGFKFKWFSEIAPFRVDSPSKVLKIGDKVPVVIKEIDEKKRINLSIKKADPNFIQPPGAASSTGSAGAVGGETKK